MLYQRSGRNTVSRSITYKLITTNGFFKWFWSALRGIKVVGIWNLQRDLHMSPAGSSCVPCGILVCLFRKLSFNCAFPGNQNCLALLNLSWFLTSQESSYEIQNGVSWDECPENSLLAYLNYIHVQRFPWLSTLNNKSISPVDLPLLFNFVRLST